VSGKTDYDETDREARYAHRPLNNPMDYIFQLTGAGWTASERIEREQGTKYFVITRI
jgi:hypothetical protein